tara:strand:- start:436 stop:1254 length:819 start_codon:yes stop_codon:yes gene_type:complete
LLNGLYFSDDANLNSYDFKGLCILTILTKEDIKSSRWRLNIDMLKMAAKIRKKNPNDFQSATLTFFGLGGRDDRAIMRRMASDPQGQRLVRERVPLPAGILKPEFYQNFPVGSLGRIYFEHCDTLGLDPEFLSIESAKVSDTLPITETHRYVYYRHRDSHDFWHVLTGYGTDMAGEAGIIGWTFAQTGNRAYGLIALLNATLCATRGRFDVFKTAWSGFLHGKKSPLLMVIDWEGYMDMPIDVVRKSIGLSLSNPYQPFEMQDAPGADKINH